MTETPDSGGVAQVVDRVLAFYAERLGLRIERDGSWWCFEQDVLRVCYTLTDVVDNAPWQVALVALEIALDADEHLVVYEPIQAKGRDAEQAIEQAVVLGSESVVFTAYAALVPNRALPGIYQTSMATSRAGQVTSWQLTQGDVFVGAGQQALEDHLQQRRPIERVLQPLTNAVAEERLRTDGQLNWVALHLTRQPDGQLEGRGALNNSPWPEALAALAAQIAWPPTAGAQTFRQFSLLRALPEEQAEHSEATSRTPFLRRLFGRR